MCLLSAALLAATVGQPASTAETAPRFRMAATADLDGDGRAEAVKLTHLKRAYGAAFTLTVDSASLTDKLLDEVDGFAIVDIDENDRYREVAVHATGPSDCNSYYLLWYNGAEVHRAGRINGTLQYLGHGIMLARSRQEYWDRTDKYTLTAEHRLRQVPQELYWVGEVKPAKKKSFPIYTRRDGDDVQAYVRAGSNVLVAACDCRGDEPSQWHYLLRTENGQLGWTRGRLYDLVYGNAGHELAVK
jgi:hypothetical protein